MSDFELITPESLGPWTGGTHAKEHSGRPFWRITLWKGGVVQRRRDFLYEPLATGWAEKVRKELRAARDFATFVKKTAHNQPQDRENERP